MAFANFTNADSVLHQIASQTGGDRALAINGSTLNQWLTTLQKTSTHLRQELQQQVANHAETSFLPACQYNNQVYQRADRQVQDAFSSSQTFLNSASLMTTQTTQTSSETNSLADQAHHSHAIVTTLKLLVEISKELDQVDAFLSQGAIVDATRQLLLVFDRQANEQVDGDDLAARYHLRTRAERYKTLLANTIHDGLTQCIVLTNDGETVLDLSIRHLTGFTHGSANTTLHLKDLLMASTLLQTQYVELASIQRNIVKKLITPLIDVHLPVDTVQLTVDELHDPAVSKLHLIMTLPTIESNDDDTNALKSYETRCLAASERMQHILVIVKFVFEHLFGSEPPWLAMRQLFGRLFLPDVFQLVITNIIAPAIPSTTTSTDILAQLASLASAAVAFERQCLVDYAGIAPSSNNTENDDTFPLSLYVNQLDKHVAHQRHSRLLHDARQVMLRQIYDTEPDVDEGISITQTPRILCAMVQEFIAEAASLEKQQHYPMTSQKLRNTIHDILVLYMSIMPSIHRPEFLHHADRAIVFRNDCYWLAAHTRQAVSDDVRTKLEQLGDFWQKVVVAQLMNTVAMVLDRTEEWQQEGGIQDQQQHRSNMTLDSKQPMGHQQQQQQQQQSMSLENAITIIIAQIHSLANSIRPVVTPTLYNTFLIELVNGVVGYLADDLLTMTDISAEASHTMALALNGIAQLANVFLSDDGSNGVSEIQLRQWIPRWQGFWMIKEMLELTMVDILAALNRGDLCMFTHQELVHLVCALFADTPRRDETLHIIKTSDLNGSTTTTKDIASLLDPVIEAPPMVNRSPQPQQHLHDRGIVASSPQMDRDLVASSSRLAFDTEEINENDGWDQEGWSDDDDLDFNITPFRKDTAPSKQDNKSTQDEQMIGGNSDMDIEMNDPFGPGMTMNKSSSTPLEENDEFDSGMNISMDQPTEGDDLDLGMTIPFDDHGNQHDLDSAYHDKVGSTEIIQEHHQEHPIEESSIKSDRNIEFDHEMDVPMEQATLKNDNIDDFDPGMNMSLDDQDYPDWTMDNENQDIQLNQDIDKGSSPIDRVPRIDDDKDEVLDSGLVSPLDLKDKDDLGIALEDEGSYSKNEPVETPLVHHEDTPSSKIEQLIDDNPDTICDRNDVVDHGMEPSLGSRHSPHMDEDNNDKYQIEVKTTESTESTEEYHQDTQAHQKEYSIGEISDMDAAIEELDTITNTAHDKTPNLLLVSDDGNDLNAGLDTLEDNQNRLPDDLLGDGNGNVDSGRSVPLDDECKHEDIDSAQVTGEDHEDSASPEIEHSIGGNMDDLDSSMMLVDTSTNEPSSGVSSESENGYEDGHGRAHEKDYHESGSSYKQSSDEQNVVMDTINDDGDLKSDIPLANSIDNLQAIVDDETLDHGIVSPLDRQENQQLDMDTKDNHNEDDHIQTTQGYHEDSRLPKTATAGNIDSNEEKGINDGDLDTKTDIRNKLYTVISNNESLNSDKYGLDMLLDDDEGGGWSDADHDIDLDLDLLSKSSTSEALPPPTTNHTINTTTTAIHVSPSPCASALSSAQNSPGSSPCFYSQVASLSPPKVASPPPPPSLFQSQQSSVVKVSPSPSPSSSKFSMIADTTLDDNYDDGDGGWSDAENIMEFDTTILPKAPTTDVNQPASKTSAPHFDPSLSKDSNNDTNTSSNKTTPPTGNKLMMQFALEDDDDLGGGWSDADEEIF